MIHLQPMHLFFLLGIVTYMVYRFISNQIIAAIKRKWVKRSVMEAAIKEKDRRHVQAVCSLIEKLLHSDMELRKLRSTTAINTEKPL